MSLVNPTLLVVDDESDNLDALERIFRKRYHFLRATSGAEALKILEQTPRVDVIITDQRMPQMTGVEFLEKTLTTHAKTVRILLTGYTDIDSIIAAVNQGHIFRYITKPWDTTDLTNSVEQAMEHYSRGDQLELKNQELERALKELKILDETKNKFMVLINHELKTPLTVISSFLALLQETALNEEQKSYMDRIQKSSTRLQEVVDDTLILTHYFAGILKLNKQTCSFKDLIRDTLLEFKDEALKKSIAITLYSTEAPLPLLSIDTTLIKRGLRHLISNALRFATAQTEIKVSLITISSEALAQTPGQTVVQTMGQTLSFENEGPPVPESTLQNLSTPFKLQEKIMNHSKGLGLGLSVVEAILKSHHSTLQIENLQVPNQPARVRVSFTLPA